MCICVCVCIGKIRHVPGQIEEVADINKSFQGLDRAELKDSTETLIIEAQKQSLSTEAIENRVHHMRQDLGCGLCKAAPETVQHRM